MKTNITSTILIFACFFGGFLFAGGGGTTAPTNDPCSGAITVSCGNSYSGTTVNSTTTGETTLPACASTSPTAGGVWYVYTGDGSTVTASLCSGTSYDSKLNVYSGSACGSITSCVASNDDGCSTQSTVTFVASAGTKYYILVNGYSGATGTFSLEITCCTPGVPSCATQNSPANGANNIANCSSLTWTAPASSGCSTVDSYDVYFGTTNPPPLYTNTTATSYLITGSPSTTYYWQIRPRNAAGSAAGCSVRSFTTAANGNPQYTLVDDSNSPSPYDCVTLTTTANDQRGCAWDINSTLNMTSSFSYDFRVNLGSSDAGADGLTFVMQNDPLGRCKCGTTGGSLGAGGITNSVVVEIDTYLNTEDRDDFSSNFIGCSGAEDPDHLDIWFNGNINPDTDGNCNATGAGERPAAPTAVRLLSGGSNYNIENGQDHILRISWNSGSQTLTASILNTALSTTYGSISSTFNPMTVFGTNTPYFGFTASTGGLNNNQSFCNPPILLPVELLSFHSYCYEEARKVYWSTASENNHDYFTLEKSVNGINFYTIYVDYSSNLKNGTQKEYEFTDLDLESKEVYYRLSQTDKNGNTKTYDIISSICKELAVDLTISAVKTESDFIDIVCSTDKKTAHKLTVIDLTGKIINDFEFTPDTTSEVIRLNKYEISTGFYILQLSNQQESYSTKVWVE